MSEDYAQTALKAAAIYVAQNSSAWGEEDTLVVADTFLEWLEAKSA